MDRYKLIPDLVLAKWQNMADVLAEAIDVPAALVMKAEHEMMEVFVSSDSANNPYKVKDSEDWHSTYCETVIKDREKLFVSNALKTIQWKSNPDIKLGMIAYLGFPITFPDGVPFGTICVLDTKERIFSENNEKLLRLFRDSIEVDLALMYSFELKSGEFAKSIIRETDERKKSEYSLRISEERYRALVELAEDIIITYDLSLNLTYVNSYGLKLFGRTRDNYLGTNLLDYIPTKYHAMLTLNHEERVVGNRDSKTYQIDLKDASGKTVPMDIRSSTIVVDDKLIGFFSIGRDVSAHVEAEAKLCTWKHLFEHAEWGIAISSADGKSMDVMNPEFAKMHGYKMEELVGCNPKKIFAADFHKDIEFNIELAHKKGHHFWEAIHVKKDGTQFPVMQDVTTMYNELGKVQYRAINVRDISEQKKSEELVMKLQTAVESSKASILVMDKNGIIEYANPFFSQVTGFTREEYLGKSFMWLNLCCETHEYLVDLWETIRTKQLWEGHWCNKKKNGELYWVNETISAIKNRENEITHYVAIKLDVTKTHETENALLEKTSQLASLSDNLPNTFIYQITRDKSGEKKFTYLSNKIEELTGVTANEVLNNPQLLYNSIVEEDRSMIAKAEEVSFQTMTDFNVEVRVVNPDGSLKWVQIHSTPRKLDDGSVIWDGFNMDITDSKNAELLQQKITADLILRNKDLEQFTYIVSHNVRAPLANIIGIVSILNQANFSNEEKLKLMDGIRVSAQKLDAIISDLNDILKLRNNIVETRNPIKLLNILNETIKNFENEIRNYSISIVSNFTEKDEVDSISSYLQSIFYNLISNCIKYRNPNVNLIVNVNIERTNEMVKLTFADNGLGIDMTKQGDKIFGLYKRFHVNHAEGKGIGLFMVKTQVEMLGGTIAVHSEPNVGTLFTICFPA